MTKNQWIATAAVVALVGGGAWYWRGQPAAPAAAPAPASNAASVQVQTAMPARHPMALTMAVYGDVVANKVASLSFPQAGQLVRLAVVPGQAVHKGDVVAVLASDPAAVAAYTQAASAVSFAQREERRLRDLAALQLATSSQVDAAAKQARDAESALASQAKLGGGAANATLRADADGAVTAMPVAQGDRVAAGATIVQVGRTDTLRVNLAIEPARVHEVKPGMAFSFDGVGAGSGVTHPVVSIQNVIDPKTMMAGAVVLLPAASSAWPVGMRVQGTIALGRRDAWELPRQAVLVDDRGAYVYQVVQNKAHRVNVNKLVETATTIGVEGAIDAAAPVVVVGNYELADDMAVRGGQP